MTDQRNGGIEWTDQTWNCIRGCSKVSQGCKHCYAETMAARFSKPGQPYAEVITDGRWNGKVVLVPEHLADPLRWKRARRIFVNSMSDLFHESLTNQQIAAVFGVMAAAGPRHTFQVLTKRPERARQWFEWLLVTAMSEPHTDQNPWTFCHFEALMLDDERETIHRMSREAEGRPWPLPNVWLGVSVEDQKTADERIPLLLKCPASVRWVSFEPLLGPVKIEPNWLPSHQWPPLFSKARSGFHDEPGGGIGWAVVGGESGPGARPMHPDWARSLRDQCAAGGVPYLFKQWGDWNEHGERVGKKVAGRLLDGVLHDGYPQVSP